MPGHVTKQLAALAVLLATTGLLAGCSGIRTYPNQLDKNFFIQTTVDSGSIISTINATLDIYDVNKTCQASYVGTVKLNQNNTEVGIVPGKTSYISVRFDKGGFLSNSSCHITYETLIKPRKEYRYEVNVRYVDDIYNVEIVEKRSPGLKGHEVPIYPLNECKKVDA